MKVLKEDYKNKEFQFIIDNDDDLWNLYLMIDKSDLVSGIAYRKISINNTNEVKKIRVFTTIEVEKTEYKGNQLKVLGKTVVEHEEIPKNSYQSINLEPGDQFKLQKKEINRYFREKLEESKKPKYMFLIALFDRNEWLFAEATNSSVRELSRKSMPSSKRIGEDKEYYSEFVKELKSFLDNREYSSIIIGSPFIFRNKLQQALSKDFQGKIVFTSVNSVNESGIKEVLTSDEIKQEMSKLKISKDSQKINELLQKISKNDKVCYGFNEVKKAVNLGAVEELIVSEKKIIELKNEDNFEELSDIMNLTEKMGGQITIISSEASKQLDAIGGLAAFLRYQVS